MVRHAQHHGSTCFVFSDGAASCGSVISSHCSSNAGNASTRTTTIAPRPGRLPHAATARARMQSRSASVRHSRSTPLDYCCLGVLQSVLLVAAQAAVTYCVAESGAYRRESGRR